MRGSILLDRLLFVGIAFAVFLTLRREVLLSSTAQLLLADGEVGASPLYRAVLSIGRALIPMEAHAVATGLCALFTAIGVGCTHAMAYAWTADRRDAAGVALVVATCPVVWLAGTVASEFAIVFAVAAGNFWAASRFRQGATYPGAILLAVVGAVLTLGHPVNVWVFAPTMAFVWFGPKIRPGVWLTYLLVFAALCLLADGLLGSQLRRQGILALAGVTHVDPVQGLGIAHREWFRALFPWSALGLALLFRRGARPRMLALLTCLVPFVVLWPFVGPRELATGFAPIALVIPLAVLVVERYRPRVWLGAAVLSAGVAWLVLEPLAQPARAHREAAGLRALAGTGEVAFAWHRNPIEDAVVLMLGAAPDAIDLTRATPADLERRLMAGDRVILGLHTRAKMLRAEAKGTALMRWRLADRFALTLIQSGDFRCYELRPRR